MYSTQKLCEGFYKKRYKSSIIVCLYSLVRSGVIGCYVGIAFETIDFLTFVTGPLSAGYPFSVWTFIGINSNRTSVFVRIPQYGCVIYALILIFFPIFGNRVNNGFRQRRPRPVRIMYVCVCVFGRKRVYQILYVHNMIERGRLR